MIPPIEDRAMDDSIGQILAAAALAPSGDNTQPVRFVVDAEGRTITLVLDPTRDPSPMNAGQRMARMAAGASLENLVRAAEALGLGVEIGAGTGDAVGVVRLSGDARTGPGPDAALLARVTNRRPYDGRPVAADVLDRLGRATPPIDGVTTHWIVEGGRLAAFAALIGRADAAMFGAPAMRNAFLSKVRFDRPRGDVVDEGLSIASLEVGAADRLALRAMRRAPDRLLRLGGAGRVFAAKARKLVSSASGLCLVVAPDGAPATDVIVGRALQRAWLALAKEGLAAQPMMSLPVLENVGDHGDDALQAGIGRAKLDALRLDFRALAPEIGGRRPAWLKRFGFAPPPSGRTGRLPVDAMTSTSAPLGNESRTAGVGVP